MSLLRQTIAMEFPREEHIPHAAKLVERFGCTLEDAEAAVLMAVKVARLDGIGVSPEAVLRFIDRVRTEK